MKKKVLNKMLVIAFAAVFVASGVTSIGTQTANAASKNYVIRDYSQYAETANLMVGGYYAPDLTNAAEVETLINSGLDFICLNGNNTATNWAGLGDIFNNFDQNGMKILLDANKCSNPDAMGYWSDALGMYVSGWNRDCVIGTDFWDEPTQTSDIDTIASYIEAFEGAFAGKQFFVNLMPSYYDGFETYQEFINLVEYYAATVLDNLSGQKVLGIDSYPLCHSGSTNYIRQSYLADLATIAVKAKSRGADVSYYVQTMDAETSGDTYRNLAGQADADMQYSISMAFGAKQLINFCYETPNGGFMSEAMVKQDGTPTANYTYVQNAIKNVDAMDEAYMQFDWNGVIISKGTTYDRLATGNNKNIDGYSYLSNSLFANEIAYANSYSATQKAYLTKDNLRSVTSTETTLVGCFEDDMGYNGYFLANANDTSRNNASTVTMTFDLGTDKVRVYRGTGYTDQTLSGNTLSLNMSSGEGVFVVPFKTESGYAVNLNVNGETETTFVAENGSFVLPERTVDGEIFVGWEYNGKAYPAEYSIDNVTSDITLTAITLDMDMRVGASVRIASDYENSIRWIADVDKTSLTALENAVGASNVSYGITVKSTAITGSLTINIPKENFGNGGNTWTLAGVMTKVPDEQLNTKFEGRAFVKVTFADGTQKKIFASGNDNERSIAQVAYMAYNDKDYGYTEAQLERLLVLSLPYTESSDNNGSLNDWIAGMDKDNLGSLEDWLLNAGK